MWAVYGTIPGNDEGKAGLPEGIAQFQCTMCLCDVLLRRYIHTNNLIFYTYSFILPENCFFTQICIKSIVNDEYKRDKFQ